jgi:hypothetical protein
MATGTMTHIKQWSCVCLLPISWQQYIYLTITLPIILNMVEISLIKITTTTRLTGLSLNIVLYL